MLKVQLLYVRIVHVPFQLHGLGGHLSQFLPIFPDLCNSLETINEYKHSHEGLGPALEMGNRFHSYRE